MSFIVLHLFFTMYHRQYVLKKNISNSISINLGMHYQVYKSYRRCTQHMQCATVIVDAYCMSCTVAKWPSVSVLCKEGENWVTCFYIILYTHIYLLHMIHVCEASCMYVHLFLV